jgi:photosystem II stability/assembly factor-like uncharacterized protein
MRIPRHLCIIAALLILLAERDACAQWKNVAPGLLGATDLMVHPMGSAMEFKDGIIWAANVSDLWKSMDTGKTWTKANFPTGPGISEICFYDSLNGVVATDLSIFITTDGGNTWRRCLYNNIQHVRYFGASSNILALEHRQASLYLTTNGGISWRGIAFGQYGLALTVSLDQSITVFSGNNYLKSVNAWTNTSYDNGLTWTPNGQSIDGDCYTLLSDSCDVDRMYLVNEDYASTNDNFSQVFVSTDHGVSWSPTFSHPSRYLSGAMGMYRNVIYTGTVNNTNGVERSTDYGMTWKNISGPSMHGDSHAIAIINENIVFVVDSLGSIWGTFNSGGDSVIPSGFRQLILSTTDQAIDTIGGSVYIPITISGLDQTEDIELILHFDNALKYEGSYSGATQLDIANEQWAGRSRLHIAQAKNGIVLGYAKFDVFGDSIPLHVTFDSVTVLTSVAPCQYILPASVTSIITPPSGCGVQTLTNFLRDGTMPQLSIVPNPTSGEISISSTGDLGEVSITVYDMLGVKQNVGVAILKKNNPAKILLPVSNGIYNIEVRSLQSTWNLRAVVNH